ncbi:MAG: molybdopterin-binding protein [Eubacteriales bacterium]|nr:molybdopterin-binding protein [Eubacteriales bacterium]
MKLINTEAAVGHVLCHDLTQIIPGVSKGPAFRKGHIVRPEDIPVLLSMGKEHLYIWESDEHTLHENDAAEILCRLCQGPGMCASEPKEGKIQLTAEWDGLFLADVERMRQLNSIGEIIISTRFSGFPVKKGDVLCGTRVIPLVIAKDRLAKAEGIAGDQPLLSLLPMKPKPYAVIATGSEVKKGLIEDRFTPVVDAKMAEYGCPKILQALPGDDPAAITAEIKNALSKGAEIVLCTGGMSVDPDDRTPLAIRQSGVKLVGYGAPVLPGAMFMMSYTEDNRAVCGLPGCVMYAKRTIFDLALPRMLAEVPITAKWLNGLGNGGLCLNCPECHFPNCTFGKGA